MPRPIQADINLHALLHNHRVVRQTVGPAKIWSVLKANAYGHGLIEAARALAAHADGFALLGLEDALALRGEGLTHPVLLVEGFFDEAELPLISQHGFTPVLHRVDQVRAVVAAGLPMAVYLKINTGMNRLGITPADFAESFAALQAARHVRGITLMTHFAQADDVGIEAQLALFRQTISNVKAPLSMANSAALLRFTQARGDWVRPGIMLYGSSPMPPLASAQALGLQPVMTLKSALIATRDLSPGESVGYGATFTATGPMRMGVVACGYADGYPRHAGTGTPVLVEGQRTRLIGRVSMDMLAVDLTPVPQAKVGSPVVLWGEGLPADEVASAAGTISYELLTALARRVPIRTL
jgi:alanine racemase